MTLCSSKNCFRPRPSQPEHAPAGLLKENKRGSSSEMLCPHFLQANRDENTRSFSPLFPSIMLTTASPSASWIAVSKLSARRCSRPGRIFNRSITTSMECFLFFSSSGGYSISHTKPLTRARMNPLVLSSLKTWICCPLRFRTMGASTIMRVSAGSAMTLSTIWDTVWASSFILCSGQ